MKKAPLSEPHRRRSRDRFTQRITDQERRKLRARAQQDETLWFGLGLLGLVGWSIVVPTLLGLALGVWLDEQFPGQLSWTLTLMVAGLTLGCLNAWTWVAREQAAMEERSDPSVPNNQEEPQDE